MVAVDLLAACVLDRIAGDPRWMPHPVRLMGALIVRCESLVRTRVASGAGLRAAGLILALFVPAFSFCVAWGALDVARLVHPWLGHLTWIVLGYTTLAAKDLADHAWTVYRRLDAGSPEEARQAVSFMVGRETDRLGEADVVRATVESIAENTSDGVIAPLFYLVIGGPPLALAYKAVNTLDSMIGHRHAWYRDFGWAAARLDDLANAIPSRLSAGLLVLSSHVRLKNGSVAWRVYCRDCAKHASPNSGHPEAAMAGALEIPLGGPSVYRGIRSDRPRLGDPVNSLHPRHIPVALALMWRAFALAALLGAAVATLWNGL